MSTRSFRESATDRSTFYPRLFGHRGAVTAESHLASNAGAELLKAGGTAIDAVVAATLVEGLVNAQMHTIGGECPMLIWHADSGRTVSVNGNTEAPASATVQAFLDRGLREVPEEGILAAGVPAALGALVESQKAFGRMSFADVAAPALELARDGFPMPVGLVKQEHYGLRDLKDKFQRQWPGSASLYTPGGVVPTVGEMFSNYAFADMLEYLIACEANAHTREAGLNAVLSGFYRGDVAKVIMDFVKTHEGLLAADDLASFETLLEEPVSLDYAEVTVYKCGFWNQGPVLLQTLGILRSFDLLGMGHNSAEYIHHVVEAMKLAFADREQYYGDPRYVDIPIPILLSREYAEKRARLLDPRAANIELRPGDPTGERAMLSPELRLGGRTWGPGTVHVDAIDRHGNMVSATPSGAWIRSSEVVPALGFPLGNRLMTFYLKPVNHPNLIGPRKRPRTTISPSLVMQNGQPWMVFGSMGGDQQDQWQLQFLLNRVVFDMNIQEAIEAPKFSSEHFSGFFAPHDRFPNRLRVEPRIAPHVLDELRQRGHDIEVGADWSEGFLLAASRDPRTGVIEAGCDPRSAKSEVFSPQSLCW